MKSLLLATPLLLVIAGCDRAAGPDGPASTTWPEIAERFRSPAPRGARFTADMSWADIFKLPKIWGMEWSSPQSFDAKAIALDQLDYPPLKPEYLAQSKARVQAIIEGKAETQQSGCKPNGMTRSIWYTAAPTFLFQPGDRLIVHQAGEAREIWMDGRPHPAQVNSNDNSIKYQGHSIGWWEGETLVIDTMGVHPNHELFYGVPNKGQHIVERWSLDGADKLKVVMTVDAPEVLEKPWVFEKYYESRGFGGPPAPRASDGPTTTRPMAAQPKPTGPRGGRIATAPCDRADSRQKVDEKGNLHLDLTPPEAGVH